MFRYVRTFGWVWEKVASICMFILYGDIAATMLVAITSSVNAAFGALDSGCKLHATMLREPKRINKAFSSIQKSICHLNFLFINVILFVIKLWDKYFFKFNLLSDVKMFLNIIILACFLAVWQSLGQYVDVTFTEFYKK